MFSYISFTEASVAYAVLDGDVISTSGVNSVKLINSRNESIEPSVDTIRSVVKYYEKQYGIDIRGDDTGDQPGFIAPPVNLNCSNCWPIVGWSFLLLRQNYSGHCDNLLI